jgi:hypothetical protein
MHLIQFVTSCIDFVARYNLASKSRLLTDYYRQFTDQVNRLLRPLILLRLFPPSS